MRFVSFFTTLAWLITSTIALSSSTNCVSTNSSPSSIPLVSEGKAAPVFVSKDEWPGVYRTAMDFVKDVNRVTGTTPKITNVTSSSGVTPKNDIPVLVGTLGHSTLISSVLAHVPLATAAPFVALNGSWEAYHAQIVSNPLPGVDKAYVIVGSDRRGTIFALYELSEQSGVSPWFWWADVPIKTSKNLFLTSTPCSHGPPTVKYRGIFLNDEQPALQNWASEKFTNNSGGAGAGKAVGGDEPYGASGDPTSPDSGTNPVTPFNRYFYTKLFELILRLKGNYLWPGKSYLNYYLSYKTYGSNFLAQWGSSFGVDDVHNQFLADLYGIVMGTSHEEPMMRSIPNEWNEFGSGAWDFSVNAANITQFWIAGTQRAKGFDEIYTIGMRGNGDEPLLEGQDISLLENVVSIQRDIISFVYNITDVTTIPQMWTLYKEVLGFYGEDFLRFFGIPVLIQVVEGGMRVPGDVCLVWTDDNHHPDIYTRQAGAILSVFRSPKKEIEQVMQVGTPRDYKWIQSSQLAKIQQQMSLAYERGAQGIWILNVGDLKPDEMATEFFLTYGYDVLRFNHTNVNNFTNLWAMREFDLPASEATIVTEIMNNVTRWNMRRKPELLNSTTYSLTNYREADIVLAGWEATVQSSTKIYNSLPESTKPAFFQLVHHPVLASANIQTMWVLAGKNNLYGSQARLSTNSLADQVTELFDADFNLEEQYHTMLDGKWDHMMDQTHISYAYWQQPMQNTMHMITRVPAKKQALPGPMRIALEGSMGAWPGDDMFDCAAQFSCPPPDMLPLDPFTPVQTRWMDVSAGGPNSFTWTATSNVSWLTMSPSKGSISTSNTDTRVEIGVDWSKLSPGASFASIIVSANATGQQTESQQFFFIANKTTAPSNFKGFVEGDGGISITAAHTTRNVAVNGVEWTEIPNLGKTVSGMTPMPALGNNDANFSAGTGPSMQYDFYSFNNINGSVNVHVLISPILNSYGPDRPVAIATQLDDDEPQAQWFIPPAAPGALPAGWDTDDGWVANSIIDVVSTHAAPPGNHTLKIFMIEPAVVVEKIVIDTGGVRPSYLGPPESVRV